MRARDQLLAQYFFTFLKDRLVNIQLISLLLHKLKINIKIK